MPHTRFCPHQLGLFCARLAVGCRRFFGPRRPRRSPPSLVPSPPPRVEGESLPPPPAPPLPARPRRRASFARDSGERPTRPPVDIVAPQPRTARPPRHRTYTIAQ